MGCRRLGELGLLGSHADLADGPGYSNNMMYALALAVRSAPWGHCGTAGRLWSQMAAARAGRTSVLASVVAPSVPTKPARGFPEELSAMRGSHGVKSLRPRSCRCSRYSFIGKPQLGAGSRAVRSVVVNQLVGIQENQVKRSRGFAAVRSSQQLGFWHRRFRS